MKDIEEAKEKWEQDCLKKNMERLGLKENPTEIYTPLHIEGQDYLQTLGFPGEFPFTRGNHAIPLYLALWGRGKDLAGGKLVRHAFGYAGFGAPEDYRDFLIKRGETGVRGGGPNIAFDLPTQCGYDSDDKLSEGEVGKVGVAVDTLRDFEIIYEAFTGDRDLDKIASNWTINSATNIILAMYIALAKKRNIPIDKLSGTPQNDILKEFVSRGTQVFPVGPSMRMTRDTFTYCAQYIPRMNVISICGYHIREAGATRVQSVAFAFANAIAYIQTAINAGLDLDRFMRHVTFLSFGGGMEFLKEVAIRRAARRVWAKIMRERLGSKDPRNWIITELGGGLAGYWTATKQRPLNNLVRMAIGAAFAAMIGEPPMPEPPYDEPLGLGHSIEARQLAVDAARIIVEECKLGDVADPLAGSYYIESLTNRYEGEIFDLIHRIDEMGGAVKAVESGWMKEEIMKSVVAWQKKMGTGEEIQVGVNKYTEPDEVEVMPPRTPEYESKNLREAGEKQIENLRKVKRERDNEKVQSCLEKIENAARDDKANLIPFFVEAVEAYASIGEICGRLRNVFGEAR